MTFSLGEYQDIFLEEADEQLQELNQNLLELEKDPDDIEIINNIFRAAHSLKSSAAFVGLNDLSDLAHKMENLLQGIRDRTLNVTPKVIDVIFKCFDKINDVIETVSDGEEPTQNLSWLIEEIQAISENVKKDDSSGESGKGKNGVSKNSIQNKTVLEKDDVNKIRNGIENGHRCLELIIYIANEAQMKWVKAQLVLSNLEKIGDILKTTPGPEQLSDNDSDVSLRIVILSFSSRDEIVKACNIDLIKRVDVRDIVQVEKDNKLMLKFEELEINELIVEDVKTPIVADEIDNEINIDEDIIMEEDPDNIEEHLIESDKVGEPQTVEKRRAPMLKTVKVSVDKLDQLLNNVGELVIANSGFYKLYEEIRQITGDKSIAGEFKNRMEQMSRIAKDLQTGIMKTRMVQIGQVFSRFNRLVRDLAKEHGKNIELIIKGEDTELDKKVIDVIGEPLLHLIRNAADHGIETPAERKKSGKSEVACITLNAYQGGNQIFVQISDDGRGLDAEEIKRKVIEKKLQTVDALASMDSVDIFNFIFVPGFSTASKITDTSGRGVGMNVVKEIVSELNGSVNIETEPGMGTQFILTFPLTLAIIPAIMVRVRKELYAIPLSDVIETIKLSSEDITTIEGHEVVNFRGEILSLLRLSNFIGIKSGLSKDQKVPVVVVGFGNRKIGLIVDLLEGKMEIVIKSLDQNYKTVEGFAGASILGDGSICLILDIAAMINKVINDQDSLIGAGANNYEDPYEDDETEEISDNIISSTLKKKDEIVFDNKPVSKTSDSEIVVESKEKENEKDIAISEIQPVEKESLELDKVSEPVVEEKIEAENKHVIVSQDEIQKEIPEEKYQPIIEKTVETSPVENAVEVGISVDEKVQEALKEFKNELKDNIEASISKPGDDEMENAVGIKKDDLREFQLIANVGAANAAESLSKILNISISLSIPEVSLMSIEKIPSYIGDIDSIYIGVMMPIVGEAEGTLLFILHENVGFDMIDMLYGTTNSERKELSEDGESALNEMTNIVGSSVINVLAEKSGFAIKPDVPVIVHDYVQSIIDSILVLHNMTNDYAIVMDTAFYFEDDKVVGNLLLLPEAESLKKIIGKIKDND